MKNLSKAKEKIILAYSGGLDTSVILKWLIDKGYEVICFVADVGQEENFELVKNKALKIGASKVYIEDLRKKFVNDYIFQALKWNAIYEGRYLLGTALARPLIAQKQIEIAQTENAKYVAHGSTGKGNDQVRFELSYYACNPQIKVFSPWKDQEFLAEFKGRSDMINYAQKHNIPIKASLDKPYSEDDNLMHISHEAGILEDPLKSPSEDVFSRTVSPQNAPDEKIIIKIYFENGLPIKVINENNGDVVLGGLNLFIYLNKLGSINAVGRLDMVENRFIGIKSRGIYETPGATILWQAHRDLEGLTMDKEVMHLRDMLMPKFAEIVYNGFWFSPEMNFLMAAIKQSQKNIDGYVILSLYKGNIQTRARYSKYSLYDQKLSSMDLEGGFNAIDSKGFIKINSIRLKLYNLIKNKK